MFTGGKEKGRKERKRKKGKQKMSGDRKETR